LKKEELKQVALIVALIVASKKQKQKKLK